MNLPSAFRENIVGAFGQRGGAFLKNLPDLLGSACRRWGLEEVKPATDLAYNFVAFAERGQEAVVLKIGVPSRELSSEIAALRAFDGDGAVRLLDADAAAGMLLLERLSPGDTLSGIVDDAQATRIAAALMLRLRRIPAARGDLIPLDDLVERFGHWQHEVGSRGSLDPALASRALAIFRNPLAWSAPPSLVHADLHHFNILSSARGWLAIDPKGVIGPAEYELGPFMLNPWVVTGLPPDIVPLVERRLTILSEQMHIEQHRILEWALAHAVLSAWWSFEEGADSQRAMQCAKIFAELLDRR